MSARKRDALRAIRAQAEEAIQPRDAVPGVPGEGPYPATVEEVATELAAFDSPDADTPERRQFRLYALLRGVAYGMVTRHGDDVWVDGVPANDLQTLTVSVLDKRGWLVWFDPDHRGVKDCALSEAGDAQIQAWDTELFGPPTEPVVSSRPLTCLDDIQFTAEDERRLMALIYEVTPEDLAATDETDAT